MVYAFISWSYLGEHSSTGSCLCCAQSLRSHTETRLSPGTVCGDANMVGMFGYNFNLKVVKQAFKFRRIKCLIYAIKSQ